MEQLTHIIQTNEKSFGYSMYQPQPPFFLLELFCTSAIGVGDGIHISRQKNIILYQCLQWDFIHLETLLRNSVLNNLFLHLLFYFLFYTCVPQHTLCALVKVIQMLRRCWRF